MPSETKIVRVVATNANKVKDLPIVDGSIIFVQDKERIAFDNNGIRKFYNQITILNTDQERTSILAPVNERFYFVIETAVLWYYNDEWVRVTTPPEDIIYIGDSLPGAGNNKSLYVNKANKNISIWDNEKSEYVEVGSSTSNISEEQIAGLFI